MDIPHEKQFHFNDGTSVASIEDLKRKIEGISYQEFYHHVNSEKNDFANWVRHVLHEMQLADDLEKVTSIVETAEILGDHLQPMPVERPHDDIQSRIEEEDLSIHIPVTDAPGRQEADLDAIQKELEQPEEEAAPEEAHPAPEPPKEAHMLSEHDYTRLIVKDFMYGLVFGLIIGLILGRILTF